MIVFTFTWVKIFSTRKITCFQNQVCPNTSQLYDVLTWHVCRIYYYCVKAIYGQKKLRTAESSLLLLPTLCTDYVTVLERKGKKRSSSIISHYFNVYKRCSDSQISRTEEAPSHTEHKLRHENPNPDKILPLILDVWAVCVSWSQHSKKTKLATKPPSTG